MERRRISVAGTVQGVGFRPFVHCLASRLNLRGFVKNLRSEVSIELEGEPLALDEFLDLLITSPPPLARIDDLRYEPQTPRGDGEFAIAESDLATAESLPMHLSICPDIATCKACVLELFDSTDRRYRYPFINCTHCGPRLTIITGNPYDRARTTMSLFEMCTLCRAEYENPAKRRFYAQPIACPCCGPRLSLRKDATDVVEGEEALACTVELLKAGNIGAIKSIGGYHLVCDATNAAVLARLRSRKHRDEKPFAVMVRDSATARALCEVDTFEEALLASPSAPIVLLRKRLYCGVADLVAPDQTLLGLMLPYTPLHHLLLNDMDGTPLVMTSANRRDEPVAYQDKDVIERLHGIADFFLLHDRAIQTRCDDSVARVVAGQPQFLRRSRGYAPEPIRLPFTCPSSILAVGGQLKNTFALAHGDQAILSHHMGDLENFEAYRAFDRDIAWYEDLLGIEPMWIAHDLHPDYASTRYALEREAKTGLKPIPIQHHHAHMCSCMTEHGLHEPVIGISFDGTGLGTDGAIWGGEFLVGDYHGFKRAAHLRYVSMPGGEAAVREPWRMAVAQLLDAGCSFDVLAQRIPLHSVRTAERMIHRGINAPRTSSAGRLFDAVAAIIGLRDYVKYEGQAAMQLESLAASIQEDGAYSFEICKTTNEAFVIDTRPIIGDVVKDFRTGKSAAYIARCFHVTLSEAILDVCERVRRCTGIDAVVLSGGTFLNAILTAQVNARLLGVGFRVYRHRQVPTNDGGLSLGQVAIAAAQIQSEFNAKSSLTRELSFAQRD